MIHPRLDWLTAKRRIFLFRGNDRGRPGDSQGRFWFFLVFFGGYFAIEYNFVGGASGSPYQ